MKLNTLWHYFRSCLVSFGTDVLRLSDVSQITTLMMSHWKSKSIGVNMITIKQCSILLQGVSVETEHMHRLQKSWKRYLSTKMLGEHKSWKLGETPLTLVVQATKKLINNWNAWRVCIDENWDMVGFETSDLRCRECKCSKLFGKNTTNIR